mmetsp:Transcript_8158/g.15139  ORF Transcript_8158/g.15139 Transcript_8158/m.15139 type:complete len:401 (+) Transcript_8158:72-1274(+)
MSVLLNVFRSRPKVFRIFLVRHGESIGNIQPEIYKSMPDHKIPLTDRGREMARNAGQKLQENFRSLYGANSKIPHCRMWVSPFARTRETAKCMLETCGEWISDVKESPFLVEQDWGLFEGSGIEDAETHYPEEWRRLQRLRQHQGKFWARMPMGESCFDVCQRVSSMFGAIQRDRQPNWIKGRDGIENIVIVSHGVTIRSFLMMWCHYSPEWFEVNRNPPNCSIVLVEGGSCRYVYPGYGVGGTELSREEVVFKPDPMANFTLGQETTPGSGWKGASIRYMWTDKDTAAAKEFFIAIDKDENGTIDRKEAADAMGSRNILISTLTQSEEGKNLDFDTFLGILQREAGMIPPPIPYYSILNIATGVAKGKATKSEAERQYIELVKAAHPQPDPDPLHNPRR